MLWPDPTAHVGKKTMGSFGHLLAKTEAAQGDAQSLHGLMAEIAAYFQTSLAHLLTGVELPALPVILGTAGPFSQTFSTGLRVAVKAGDEDVILTSAASAIGVVGRFDNISRHPAFAAHPHLRATYQDVFEHCLCLALPFEADRFIILCLGRSVDQPAFVAADAIELAVLLERLAKVILRHQPRGQMAQPWRLRLADMARGVNVPLLILDRNAQVLAQSANAAILLAQADQAWLSTLPKLGGRRAAIVQADIAALTGPQDFRRYEIASDDDQPVIRNALLSCAPAHWQILAGETLYCLTLEQPPFALDDSVAMIGAQYRLSPAETRLLCAFVQTSALDAAAEILGIKIASARKYIKAIYHKMDVGGQAELMRFVLRHPFVQLH